MRDSTGSPQVLPKDVMAHNNELANEHKGADYADAGYAGAMHHVPEEQHVNVAAVLKGSVAGRTTLFEKKAALINAEIDKMGMGKYQICIWFLTGFGYFLDLGWSRTMGLTSTAIYQEMGIPNNRTGLIFTLANVGLATGALGFGIIVDIIGRKWAFNITCLITSVLGLLMAAPKYNYEAICAIYLFASIGLGGNIPIDALIALEFLPQNRRNLVSLLSMWQPIGVICACAVAYGTTAKYRCTAALPGCNTVADGIACCRVEDNMGWRYNIIIMGLMTLVIFFLRFFVFTFHESPKFLLSRGREQEAIDVLHAITKFNKQPPPTLTLQHFRDIEQAETTLSGTTLNAEMDPVEGEITAAAHAKQVTRRALTSVTHLKSLFTNKLQLFIFILFAITYMGDYWSFNLAGSFLPIVLLQNNVSTGRGTVVETYRQYIYIALPGILGAGLALLSVSLPLFGRKWSLVFSAAMQGLSMAMYTQVKTTVGYVGLNAMEYLMQTYFNAVLYASAPELFDTAYRGSASGMLSCLGRLSGIVAPFAGQYYLSTNSSGILWLGAGGIWIAAVAMVFLPVEMRNRQMF